MDLGQNRILTGNHTKSEGLIVSIDANGVLSNAVPVNLNTSQWKIILYIQRTVNTL
jgi:hypothetical protein